MTDYKPSRTRQAKTAKAAAAAEKLETAKAYAPLTGKQRHALRGDGHHLHVLVQVGQDGLTDGVVAALNEALATHELVKVQIADEREARRSVAAQLAEKTGSEIAQELGRTALFFKRNPKKSKYANL
jgi:RNA-binding protein